MSDASGPPPYLTSLSTISAKSFASTAALTDAILTLITEQLGLRTSFLTHITPDEQRNHVVAAHNAASGSEVVAGSDLVLQDTF